MGFHGAGWCAGNDPAGMFWLGRFSGNFFLANGSRKALDGSAGFRTGWAIKDRGCGMPIPRRSLAPMIRPGLISIPCTLPR